MADFRMSNVLPTIKCSMCAREIEISMMGEHVCGRAAEPTPPLDSFAGFDMGFKRQPTNGPQLLKPGRLPPPRVDTKAANRPFFRQGQMTPVSASSDSRSNSPGIPMDDRNSPYGRPFREPMVPPSPDHLSSNLDTAFPPWPGPNQAPRRDHSQQRKQAYANPDPMYAPVSPMVTTGPLLQRMKSIAPGPFDVNGKAARRRAPEEEARMRNEQLSSSSAHSRSTTSSSEEKVVAAPNKPTYGVLKAERTGTYRGLGPPSAQEEPPKSPGFAPHGVLKVERNRGMEAFGLGPPSPSLQDERPKTPTTPTFGVLKMERNGVTGKLEAIKVQQEERSTLKPENRSQTFPLNAETRLAPIGLPRRPSEPLSGARRPSDVGSQSASPPRLRQTVASGPDRSRPLPPRGTSLIRRTDVRTGEPPPMPDLAAEFGTSNPYHTPSASESSNESMSSRPSPQRAPPRRRPSDNSKNDVLMRDIQSSATSVTREQLAKPMPLLGASMLSPAPESPMDPAMAGGRISPIPPRPKTPSEPQRRPTTSKGNCKGCGEGIKGKSVSSADGRLTGRYHKQCFVCKTCSEPFATATFYVIDDAPYCERHYHKLNGSMCQKCDRGIEGQYLETERKQKYHPHCLTCSDCRKVLRDDYFEMNGKVYCERDAYRKAQQRNLGTNRMERRTTRLMMM